ncbi:hypothetical protein G5B30_03910 [Sphingobacterium sp. SGG-5]|uniref:hypothetical protein n=1 Tax=Sphingobacterium sp. SGG-5 TaxID=2710881 RepID=UPI0013EAB77A|nr:hypothetical protein [Sphingobacterium sp. SGG-5]NGM61059.1 hypothetical protein [Sphingobacterium sp. SGG-5]
MKQKQLFIPFVMATVLVLLTTFSCNKNTKSEQASIYITLRTDEEVLMDVRGRVSEMAGKAHARISTQDMAGPDEHTIKKNTVSVVAYVIADPKSDKMQSLVITVPSVTGPGTYDIVALDGLLVYSDSQGEGMVGWEVSSETSTSHGTLHIEKIGNDELPGLGKAVMGTFSVNAKSLDGTTREFSGSFDGGV